MRTFYGDGRRRLFLLACACAGVAAIVGWAASSDNSARAASGGTLVVDNSFVLPTLDPEGTAGPTQQLVVKAMYDTLLNRTANGKLVPSLATSYTESPDAKLFTFKLRKDVKFADGTPLTSADVLFSFRRLINLKNDESALVSGVTVSAPDAYTVVLHSASSNSALPQILTTASLAILNSKLVEANGGTDAKDASKTDQAARYFNTHSAGSGPYVLGTYTTNSQVTLQANPTYWGPKPQFATVVVRNMEASTQLLNVQRGANEVAIDLSSRQASSLQKNSKLQVHLSPALSTFFLALNMNPKVSAVTSNPHIQQAIRLALNYPAELRIGGPGAVRAGGLLPPGVLGNLPPSAAGAYNLARARAEVAASGIQHPSTTLSYPSGLSVNGVQFSTLAQQDKQDLGAAGISVNLVGVPTTPFLTKYLAGQLAMSQVYWYTSYLDPNSMYTFLPGQPFSERVKWGKGSDPSLEKLAVKAHTTASDTTRAKLWRQIQMQLNKSGPYVQQFQPAQAIVGSSNLTNVVLSPISTLDVAAVGSK
jgi:peptide/nickel transport system substrate-binding protein